jgi:hypothetical protein
MKKRIWLDPYKYESDSNDKLAIFIETDYIKPCGITKYEDLFFLWRGGFDDEISLCISDKYRHLIIGVDLI